MNCKLETVTINLFNYCQKNNWAGYDPYDALNSELFKRLPFLDSRIPRLILTQLLKRSPVNVRPLLMIPKTQNPKALGLFLMALLKMDKMGMLEDKKLIHELVQNIINLRAGSPLSTGNRLSLSTGNCQPLTANCSSNRQQETDNRFCPSTGNWQLATGNCLSPSTVNRKPETGNRYYSWGYSFPWQGRTVIAPKGEANLVCTVFVANALLDLYESTLSHPETESRQPSLSVNSQPTLTGNRKPETVNCVCPSTGNWKLETGNRLLSIATSSADYLLNELYWSEGDIGGFSYPTPDLRVQVHNANFLAAALLCRVYKYTGNDKYLQPALKAARSSAKAQREDGAWDYGELPTQKWIDNFHTGFNLGALRTICQCLNTDEFEPHIRKGFDFYKQHFFREDGAPRYFHNKTYPIDIHSVAQSIITLLDFQDLDRNTVTLAHKVYEWAVNNMWDKRDYFYYQVTPYYKNKINYMRWSQSWMLLALATLLETVNR